MSQQQPSNPQTTPTPPPPSDPREAIIAQAVAAAAVEPSEAPETTSAEAEAPEAKAEAPKPAKSDAALKKLRTARTPKAPPPPDPVADLKAAAASRDEKQLLVALEKYGVDPVELAGALLGKDPTPAAADDSPTVAALKKQLEEISAQVAEQQNERMMAMVKSELSAVAKAEEGDRWELVQTLPEWQGEVVEYISEMAKAGKEVSYEAALDAVEEYLVSEAKKAMELAAKSKKLGVAPAAKPATTVEAAKPVRPALNASVGAAGAAGPKKTTDMEEIRKLVLGQLS